MRDIRKTQLLKRANLQTKEFPLIRTNHEDYVYRLYLQQGHTILIAYTQGVPCIWCALSPRVFGVH